MSRPGRFNVRKESRYSLYKGCVDLGAVPGVCVKYCLHGFRIPNLPACNEWLYRLHHRGRQLSFFLRDFILFFLIQAERHSCSTAGRPGFKYLPTDRLSYLDIFLAPSDAPEATKQHTAISILTAKLGPRAISNPTYIVFRDVSILLCTQLFHGVS
jgi:hypothetical protein